MSDNSSKKLPHDHSRGGKDFLGSMPGTETVRTVAEAMKQLGDPSRLRIFWLLCHCEECVINIAAAIAPPTIPPKAQAARFRAVFPPILRMDISSGVNWSFVNDFI